VDGCRSRNGRAVDCQRLIRIHLSRSSTDVKGVTLPVV
jgi:hypothetical protein